ncbi:hypothetical protein [Parasitella parasitica]|uniref:Uncharacterized protein n=1 Tax=Parasitella parasitica TaxID=35722 RepID=A0A0B7MP75_9FUNG|nr:hypothetical protein [Parasitella parasitica]
MSEKHASSASLIEERDENIGLSWSQETFMCAARSDSEASKKYVQHVENWWSTTPSIHPSFVKNNPKLCHQNETRKDNKGKQGGQEAEAYYIAIVSTGCYEFLLPYQQQQQQQQQQLQQVVEGGQVLWPNSWGGGVQPTNRNC